MGFYRLQNEHYFNRKCIVDNGRCQSTMAQMAHFSSPYYFTIPNSEFRILNSVLRNLHFEFLNSELQNKFLKGLFKNTRSAKIFIPKLNRKEK